jgi:hypothetical protein
MMSSVFLPEASEFKKIRMLQAKADFCLYEAICTNLVVLVSQ